MRRLEQGDDSAFAEANVIWAEPRELPEGCAKLADTMVTRGRISTTDIWQRVRILFEAGQITAAKTTLGYLKKEESPDERSLAEAARRPKRFLQALPPSLERRPTREVAVLAAVRYAREDPEAIAESLLGRLGERLPEREARYLWGRVALEGARQHHADALAWYARAGDTPLDDEQLAWKARAALRVGEWRSVRAAIDRMSPEERTIPHGHTGTAARSPRPATKRGRGPTSCALPVRPSSTACSPTRSSARRTPRARAIRRARRNSTRRNATRPRARAQADPPRPA